MSEHSAFDELLTPVLWLDGDARISACNIAFGHWLGVSTRRLLGVGLAELDAQGERLAALLTPLDSDGSSVHGRRLSFAYAGATPRFADVWLQRISAECLRMEIHPTEEFPGADPALTLPSALSAALKGLAHEVRNPLAGLKGAAQLLARRAALRDDVSDEREWIELIGSEVQRLSDLVDRLLNPAPPRAFAPVNIHSVLERVRVLAEAEAGWAVKLLRDYDPSLPDIEGDADRLTQALWNLLRNALQSGASQVLLRSRAEHGVVIGEQAFRLALRIDIADDGRGVPDDLAERIFLPLVSGRAEGSGLGLPLAQQILREHRGSLGYRSRPGHTVFTLLLPVPENPTNEP